MGDLAWPSKPVGERARHRIDWTDDLAGGDTIVSSTLEKLSGSVEMTTDGHDASQVFCWLEGGLPRTVSRFSSTIVTAAGARLVATIAIRCD